jgi:hypothetical protein
MQGACLPAVSKRKVPQVLLMACRHYEHVSSAFPMVVQHRVGEQEGRSMGNIMVGDLACRVMGSSQC